MFCMGLNRNEQGSDLCPSAMEYREYDNELDDVTSILSDACEALAETKRITFCIEGFGQAQWPVDVWLDLVTLLEQLPGLVRWLKTANEPLFKLSLYEQGVERDLFFERSGDMIQVTCRTWGFETPTWRPSPQEEYINYNLLQQMLRELVETFLSEVEAVCPNLLAHEWLQDWRHAVEIAP